MMKKLVNHIKEKLIINKNFINITNDDIEELLSHKEKNDVILTNNTTQDLRKLFTNAINMYISKYFALYSFVSSEIADTIFDNFHYLPKTFPAHKFEKGIFKNSFDKAPQDVKTIINGVFNDIIHDKKDNWTVSKSIKLIDNIKFPKNVLKVDLNFTMMTSDTYIIFAFHSENKTNVYCMIIFKFKI